MALIIMFVLAGLWLLPGGVGAGPGLPLGSPPAAGPPRSCPCPFLPPPPRCISAASRCP